MPGGGDFCFIFSTQGPEFCSEKQSLGQGFDGKFSGPGEGDGNRSN